MQQIEMPLLGMTAYTENFARRLFLMEDRIFIPDLRRWQICLPRDGWLEAFDNVVEQVTGLAFIKTYRGVST